MPGQEFVNEIKIKVNGSLLPEDIGANIQESIVDQSLNMPDMCVVKIWDHDLEILDDSLFDLGKTIEVTFSTEGDLGGKTVTLFKGEITAIEPEFADSNESLLVIRGYDKSWRGYRKTTRKAMKDQKDSDVASQVAGNIGLSPQVDSTSEVFKQLFQDNQSDLEYLHERANRIGHKVTAKDGKLYFKKAETQLSDGPILKWGEKLVSFQPRLTAAEQVSSVTVQGWDPQKKGQIKGEAKSSTTAPSIGYGKNGTQAASTFGKADLLVTDIPVQSVADANAVAKGHLDRINGNFIQAEGEAFISPEIEAGMSVKIENVGTKFSGTYQVTSVRHVYSAEGLRSFFTVQGNSTGTFTELLGRQEPIRRWHGLYPAIVTNNKSDVGDWGMVKVKFPWFADDLESYWARLISPGAGKERGFYLLPEVDDEVMVAFEQGDFNRPYVIGGLWNGKDKPPERVQDVVGGDGKVNHRIWKSRHGNYILFDDTKNQEKIEIVTVCGHHVTFDDKENGITIKSGSGVEIEIDKSSNVTLKNAQDITVSANGNMSFDAKGNIDIKAKGNLTAEATGNANFKGIQATFEGKAKAELKAPTVSVSGSALTEVKGALVKIN